MAETAQLPPHVAFNRRIASEWFAKIGLTDTEPKVTSQADVGPLNLLTLPAFSYNPCIVKHDGKLLMSCRYHPDQTYRTNLLVAELDRQGNATNKFHFSDPELSLEDCRLFTFDGELWASWVSAKWRGLEMPVCRVNYGRVSEELGLEEPPKFANYGKNNYDGIEKNWIFFDTEDGLFCIYDSQPKQCVLRVPNGGEPSQVYHTEPVSWYWGRVHGGTAPIPYGDNLIRFFHSTWWEEDTPPRWRYFVGAVEMEPKPPFKPIRVSRLPILRGSSDDDLSPEQRSACYHYKPRVVIALGAINFGDDFLLSVGINDSSCALLRIAEKQLNL